MEHLTAFLVGRYVLAVFVQIHSSLIERFLAGIIVQGYFTGECNHHITAYTLLGMVSEIFLYGKIISDCVCSAICNDHSFALTVNLITAVFQEIGHNHFRLLGNSIAMLLVILE